MPNAKVLSEKEAIVAALVERIQNSGSGILIDYKGITVAEDTELRAKMRENGIEYTVVKNTLTRKALDKLGMSGLDEQLNGTTSLATAAGDPIVPFDLLTEAAKKMNDKFNIKGAYVEGKVLTEAEIAEMASLKTKNGLYSKVLGTMIAPITGLAVCLGQILEQKGGSVAPAEEAAEAAAE